MNSFASIAAVICVAALGCSIVTIAAPQGNTRRILNTVLGAFILCTMLVPIKNAITNFDAEISIVTPEENIQVSAQEAYNAAIMVETKAGLESTLTAYLENKGISILGTDIVLDSYDNGGIYIGKISIYISQENKDSCNRIIKLTKEKFEVEPNIILR